MVKVSADSGLGSMNLHPALQGSLSPIGDLAEYAGLIGVDKDDDWLNRVEEAIGDVCVSNLHKQLMTVSADKQVIENKLTSLLHILAMNLGVQIRAQHRVTFGVGGILVAKECFVRGKIGTSYTTYAGKGILITEGKTVDSFPDDQPWYQGNKGVEIMGCVFSHAKPVPTILYTPLQFKVFLESREQKIVLTYPQGSGTSSVNETDFLRILATSLLQSSPISSSAPPPVTEKIDTSDKKPFERWMEKFRRGCYRFLLSKKNRRQSRYKSKFLTSEEGARHPKYRVVTRLSSAELATWQRIGET